MGYSRGFVPDYYERCPKCKAKGFNSFHTQRIDQYGSSVCPNCRSTITANDLRAYWNSEETKLAQQKVSPPPKNSKAGCYIATAVYGDYNSPEVIAFREFRDKHLLKKQFGISIVRYYYKHSPFWADRLKKHSFINKIVKVIFLDNIYKYIINKNNSKN